MSGVDCERCSFLVFAACAALLLVSNGCGVVVDPFSRSGTGRRTAPAAQKTYKSAGPALASEPTKPVGDEETGNPLPLTAGLLASGLLLLAAVVLVLRREMRPLKSELRALRMKDSPSPARDKKEPGPGTRRFRRRSSADRPMIVVPSRDLHGDTDVA